MHLVTRGDGSQPMGVNWRGRRSPEFNRGETPYRLSPARAGRVHQSYGA